MNNKQKGSSLFIRGLGVILIGLTGFMLFRAAPVAFAAGTITLDGTFADWSGQSCLSDPQFDAIGPETDIKQFCFATNAGDSNTYFMLERFGSDTGKPLDLVLYFDINNNGSYGDAVDKTANIRYNPTGPSGYTEVSANGWSASGDWGLSNKNGGTMVEWKVPFSALGIDPGQPIRMYIISMQGSKISDGSTEVQWSPANALGWLLIAAILVAGSTYFTFRRRSLETKA
ncbi:MAG: hypothetical protein C0401_11300 [Anaerolinea sp.]|nr:hypothetical protein [Anaerolinea sp.]